MLSRMTCWKNIGHSLQLNKYYKYICFCLHIQFEWQLQWITIITSTVHCRSSQNKEDVLSTIIFRSPLFTRAFQFIHYSLQQIHVSLLIFLNLSCRQSGVDPGWWTFRWYKYFDHETDPGQWPSYKMTGLICVLHYITSKK